MKKILLYAFLMTASLNAAILPVARNGEAASAILVDLDAPRPVQHAARELQNYFRLLSTARIPILQSCPDSRQICFIIGTLDSPLIKPVLNAPHAVEYVRRLQGNDGFAVDIRGKHVYIYASSGRGVINAVHRLIMRHTDFIWVRPVKESFVCTVDPDLQLDVRNHIDIPVFELRGWAANGGIAFRSEEFEIYCSRLCNNFTTSLTPHSWGRRFDHDFIFEYGGTAANGNIIAGHNMSWFWLKRSVYGATHPEYYMMVNGERITSGNLQLCYTNAAMTREFIANVLREVSRLPSFYSRINLMIDDTPGCCECPECLNPITLPDGRVINQDHPAFRSTQYHLFLNQVAAAVAEKYPALEIKSYGYFFTATPPLIPLHPNISVSFCPYIRNDKEPITGPGNAVHKRRIIDYAKLCSKIIWREYYYSMAGFPRPLGNIAALDLRFIRRLGVRRVYSEISWGDRLGREIRGLSEEDFFTICGPEFWVLNRLFWNPAGNPDELRAEYIRRVYREGAPGVIKFYDLLRDSFLNDPAASAYNDDFRRSWGHYVVDKNLVGPCRQALQEALAAVKDPRSKMLLEKLNTCFERLLTLAVTGTIADVRVPKIDVSQSPGFDFDSGVWNQAGSLPPMRVMGIPERLPAEPTDVRIFHNGRTLFIAFRCPFPGTASANAPQAHDRWPRGDHAEIFLTPADGRGYYHLAFDCNGNTYDAYMVDTSWNPEQPWKVEIRKTENEWRAVVEIPMAEFGIRIEQNNRVDALFYRARPGRRAGETVVHSSWGGARVHSGDGFGTLVFQVE